MTKDDRVLNTDMTYIDWLAVMPRNVGGSGREGFVHFEPCIELQPI